MRRNHLTIAAASCVAAMALTPAIASAKPTITISGSTSVAPLTGKLLPKYLAKGQAGYNKAKFVIYQGGSDIGVADVAASRSVMGEASRDPKASDPGGLVWNKIARDAICLITNSGNPVSNLTAAQVTAIFTGATTNWSSALGGSTKTGPISLVVRTAASGTQDAFAKLFGVSTVAASAAQKASNGLIQQSVKSDPNAIGYVSEAFTSGTNVAKYKGVSCTLINAKSNAYPAVRNFWYITKGAPTTEAARFINWVKTSPAAKTIIASGWVPLS